jgi:hypothetical protein
VNKQLLILTGPQGSGNHVWSKIFALHPRVYGWRALLDQYWIGHDCEPFAEYWQQPDRLCEFDWSQSDYFVTSISCPYMLNGERTVPDFEKFILNVEKLGHTVKVAIIGRDQNIIKHQQSRVRGEPTVQLAIREYEKLSGKIPYFLSYELLHLYRVQYLKMLNAHMKFPIIHNESQIAPLLCDDTNAKYVCAVEHHSTDELARAASRKWRQ